MNMFNIFVIKKSLTWTQMSSAVQSNDQTPPDGMDFLLQMKLFV